MQRAETRPSPALAVAATVLAAVGLVWAIVDVDTLAVAAAPALVVGAVIFMRPSLGLVLLAFLLPFEDVLLFAGGATLTKAAGVLVAGVWFAQKLLRRESWQKILQSPAVIAALVFIAFAWLSVLWAEWPQTVTPQVLRLLMMLAFCVLVMDLVRDWDRARWIVRALVAGGVVAASLVLLQHFGGARRAGSGVAGGINATAMTLVVLIPLGFVLIRDAASGLWRLVGLTYVALAVLAVGVTFSRMSYIVLAVVLILEGWRALRTPGVRIVSVLLLTLGLGAALRYLPLEAVQERAATIAPYVESTLQGGPAGPVQMSERGFHLRVALEVFRDNPFLGVGYFNFGRHFLRYQFQVPGAAGAVYGTPRSAHSAYLAILADLGLVGGVLWMIVVGIVLWGVWRGQRLLRKGEDDYSRVLVRAVGVSFLVILAYGVYAEIQKEKVFWLLAGLALAVTHLAAVRNGRRSEADPGGETPPARGDVELLQSATADLRGRS